ncbi:A24 family peptidase [Mycobacterium sp. Aquia_216]|uniref:A24 family peptidase n=1 Tax=Mycobacterium sp. Aquia_216 TaxID=2991729 RepID=UPI00227A9588|nr:A24 family peptidase [Mycobacterium sp. Aquia_216]WAJ47189.1 A24 family peptidase [Mycobacterium sp. Aquia_216]
MRATAAVVVVVWLAALSCYDIRQRRLPNWLTLPGAGAVLLTACCTGRALPALAGAAALAGAYLLVHLRAPAGLGAGDVKLAIGLGAFTGCFGVHAWFAAALAAPLLTTLLGMVWLARRAGPTVPHGPSMCLASALSALIR